MRVGLAMAKGSEWRLWFPTPVYLLLGAFAAFLQARYVPTWLIESRSGLQASLQVLPAALITLFVLAFTTLFVAVQQVVNVFSSRAPLILAEDTRVRRIVGRTAVLTVASFVVSGRVPDTGKPESWVTATAATILVASVLLVWNYGKFATHLIIEYTAPRSFVSRVLMPVEKALKRQPPALGMVVFRVFLLGQSVRYAIRRDDNENLRAALDGLLQLQGSYLELAPENPAILSLATPDGDVDGWLGAELGGMFVSAGEEALRLEVPQPDIDLLTDRFGDATHQAIKGGIIEEAEPLLIGLARLATTPHEFSKGVLTGFSRPAVILAATESTAEDEKFNEAAILALSGWSVAITYSRMRFGQQHPLFKESLRRFGTAPPWDMAINRVESLDWRESWANQLDSRALDHLPLTLRIGRYWLMDRGQAAHVEGRRETYREWLALARGLATWLFDKGGGALDVFFGQFDKSMFEIEGLGSPEVLDAARGFAGHIEAFLQALSQEVESEMSVAEQQSRARQVYELLMTEPYRRTLSAMRIDLPMENALDGHDL